MFYGLKSHKSDEGTEIAESEGEKARERDKMRGKAKERYEQIKVKRDKVRDGRRKTGKKTVIKQRKRKKKEQKQMTTKTVVVNNACAHS